MFESARVKLTVWYLVIIMAISVLFSVVIFARINSDLTRFEKIQVRFQQDLEQGRIREFPGPRPAPPQRLNPGDIREARTQLILVLTIINLAILAAAGALGYFLAGRTLRPIKEMVDEQNRFVTDSSHELRTPLTSLRSEIEVGLRNKSLSLQSAKKLLESNLEEVISLQVLSDNLLELSQNGSLVSKKLMKSTSLSAVIEVAIKKVEPMAKTKQIKIENKIQSGKVNGISDRLTEVFVILLDNAIKYSPTKSTVTVSSKKDASKVHISVKDHGVGIDEIDLPHIFDRFYRADKSRSKSGYGLGLSIAKKIVESHNCSINVKSLPGKETEFLVTLPSA